MRRFYYYAVMGAAGFLFGQGVIVMWPDWSAWTWWGLGTAVLVVGLGGPRLLDWVSRRVDLTRGLPDFDKTVRLLSDRNHLIRERAVRDLAEMAAARPSKFHVKVMRSFGGVLAYPPFYGSRHEKAGQTDPHSPDTVAIMEVIVSRTDEQIKAEKDVAYEFSLNPNSPFEYRDGAFWFRGERIVG